MPQSQSFITLLNSPEFLKDPAAKAKLAGLMSKPSLDEIAAGMVADKEFWNKFNLKIDPPVVDNWKFENDFADLPLIKKQIVFSNSLSQLQQEKDPAKLTAIIEKNDDPSLKAHLGLSEDLEASQYEEIRLAAKKRLIIVSLQKLSINQAELNYNHVYNLLNNDQFVFREALKGIGISEAAANSMLTATVDADVKSNIYIQMIKLRGLAILEPELNNYVALLNSNGQDFVNRLKAPFNTLLPEHAAGLRGFIAREYINRKISALSPEALLELSTKTGAADFKALIEVDINNPDEFFSAKDLELYRKYALRELAKKSIEVSNDKKALAGFGEVSQIADANKISKENFKVDISALGKEEAGPYLFLIGASRMRAYLLNAPNADLLTIIENNDFNPDLGNGKTADAYLRTNRKAVQKQAVEIFIKNTLANLLAQDLNAIEDFENFLTSQADLTQDQLAALRAIKDENPELDNLVFSQAWKSYILQEASNLDLATLQVYVNNPNIHASLDKSEKTELDTKIVLAMITNQNGLTKEQIHQIAIVDSASVSALLTGLGVNTVNLSSASLTQIQKQASKRSLELQSPSKAVSSYLSGLDFAKQQQILKDPAKTAAIAAADSAALAKILNVPKASLPAEIGQELSNVELAKKINNKALGEILGKLPIVLTPENIEKINKILISQPPATQGDCLKLIKDIRKFVKVNDAAAFNAAFGLDISDNLSDPTKLKGIMQEAKQVIELTTYKKLHNGKDLFTDAIVNILLTQDPSKIALLKPVEIKKQLAKIILDRSPGKFLPYVYNKKEIEDVLGMQISEQEYKTIIRTALKSHVGTNPAVFNKGTVYNTQLNVFVDQASRDVATLQEKFEFLIDADKGKYKDLVRLSKISTLDWLSPEFQGAAKKNALKMAPYYEDAGEQCDEIVNYLKYQQERYAGILAALPADPTVNPLNADENLIKKQAALRKHVLEQKKLVDERLATYERLQKVLNGDNENPNPSMRVGVIGMLKEAKSANRDMQFTVFGECSYEDVDLPADMKLPAESKALAQGNAAQSVAEIAGHPSAANVTRVVDKVPLNKLRVYKVQPYDGAGTPGTFVEQRFYDDLAPKQIGRKTEYLPHKKLTVSSFPTGQTEENKINYALAFATQLLSGVNKTPSSDWQILLKGSSEEELKYIWTALVILGEINPKMRFGREAIRVASTAFNPSSERGAVMGWGSESVYNKMIKSNGVTILRGAVDLYNEANYASKKDQSAAEKASKSLNQFWKEELAKHDVVNEFANDPTKAGPSV